MTQLAFTDVLELRHTGDKIPQLGFGSGGSRDLCVKSCLNAIDTGYRHIDTAQRYRNEAEVGEGVQKSGRREKVFITTKFDQTGSVEEVYQSAVESVRLCDPRENGYVDLFLIHSPHSGPSGRKVMWQVLERLVDEGKAKNIGVSNYGPKHFEEMKSYAKIWPPAVNQIELHPWTQQRSVVQYCEENGIVLAAYCPIVRNRRADDPTVAAIANNLGVTPNQVLLRYSLQKGWVPLPKSDNPDRQKLNSELYHFALSSEQMAILDNLDDTENGACCPHNIPGIIP